MKLKSVCLVGLLTVTMGVSGSAQVSDTGITVSVRAMNKVTEKKITLQDIADISCSRECPDTLGKIRIGGSPKPGKSQRISSRIIQSRLNSWKRKYGRELFVTVPETVIVETVYQTISKETFIKLFYKFVSDQAGDRKFRITDTRVKGNRPFHAGDIRIEMDEKNNRIIRDRVSVSFNVRDSLGGYTKVYVSGRLDMFDKAVVVEREIPKGDIISGSDIGLRTISISGAPSGILVNLQDVVGKQAKFKLKAGTPVQSKMLRSPSLINKGDIVKVVAASGMLTVTTVGVSKGDGGLGDQIPVENTTSGKIVIGRIVNTDTIEVLF